MMHSRGFVLSENQAFAGQTRTPGPSRLHTSPTRKNMTTGKKALGQTSKLAGQDVGSVGPKQLFGDLKASQSPVKALGNRNASKTPGPSRFASNRQNDSPGKGKGASGSNLHSSPTKKGSTELSPRKANALRSLNGKQRHTSDLPFSKPGQSSGNDAASAMMMKTPAPTQLGKARTMSRQNSFVTPAANVGRAGAIKARMGEILDAELGLSMQKADNATEQVTEHPTVQMSEEEMYPEIEYMPPSYHAKHPVFEFPDELDDLPRAKELGARLSHFSAIGLRAAGPEDLSDVEVTPMEEYADNDLAPPTRAEESDDDDPWPDVPVSDDVGTGKQSSSAQPKGANVSALTKAVQRPATTARPAGTGNGVRTTGTQRVPTSTSTRLPATTSIRTGTLAVSVKTTTKPVARSNGLQRSIASAPGVRPVSSSTAAATRTSTSSRSTAAATRPVVSGHSGAHRHMNPSSAGPTVRPTQQPSAPRTKLNPKLIDFVDDDLGKQTAAALDRLNADEDLGALQLDLGEVPAHDVEPLLAS